MTNTELNGSVMKTYGCTTWALIYYIGVRRFRRKDKEERVFKKYEI